MNRVRPYLNRFVKQKEQEIEDSYHSINLKDMKPVTSKHMTHNETILINNSKREMIKEVRDIEIERENKVLLQKISSVMGKKGNYSVGKSKNIRTKVNKSLNQFYRKRQMEEIEIENKRFVNRLQQKKPTLNMDKINKDWLDNKNVIKRMANCQFNLTSIKSSSRVRSITSEKFYKTQYDKMRVTKFKNIDGQKMLIKVEFTPEVLKITGDSQNSKELKIIEIPKEEGILFVEKDCNGKIDNVIQKLKYDSATETLYLVSDHMEQEDNQGEFNPQIDKIVAKKKEEIRNKKEEKKKKDSIESTKKGSIQVTKKKEEKKSDEPEKKSQKKKSEEKEKKTISVLEQKKEPSIKGSQKKIQAQDPLPQEVPVEPTPEKQKSVKEEHVVEAKQEAIKPQEDKYEEENFEESNSLPQEKKKSEPKAQVDAVSPEPEAKVQQKEEEKPDIKEEVKPEVKEEEKAEVKEEAQKQEKKDEEKKEQAKPQVVVAPEEVEDYNEQFQANEVS